uniref:Uncharacterized protein n=1 Tax=Schizaphis graminum TaxID=13262 RepID=A0A2S2NZU0_SCHGA
MHCSTIVRGEMCGFPLTRSDRRTSTPPSSAAPPPPLHRRHIAMAGAVRVLLSPALSAATTSPFTTVPPVKRVTRSPQRNLTQNIHTHTHTHSLFPRCRCAQNTLTHTYICIYIHTYYMRASLYSRRLLLPLPRVTATSSAPRFLVLRYWHIASSSLSPRRSPHTGRPPDPSTHPHRRGLHR